MYPQQQYMEPGMYGRPPFMEGMYPPQQPGMFPPQQQGMFPGASGIGPSPYPFPQQGMPKPTKGPAAASLIGEGYNIDARLDRIEREIVEINRRLNTLSRRVRRVENFLNIREDV